MYAILFDGQTAHNIVEETPILHPSVMVIDIGDRTDVQEGWLYDGTTWAAPVPEQASKSDLAAAANRAASAALETTITVDVGSADQHVNILVDGTQGTRADLAGFYSWGLANPQATRTWLDESGAAFSLTGGQFVSLAIAAGGWVDNVYAALGDLLSGIAAGSVTTMDQIQATSWPTE